MASTRVHNGRGVDGARSPRNVDLCDAWIKAAIYANEQGAPLSLSQISDLTTETGRSFWSQVQTNLVSRTPLDIGSWPMEELKAQWESLRPSLIKCLTIFTWTPSRLHRRDVESCSESARLAASAIYRWTGSGDFLLNKDLVVRLATHERWCSVLKPLLMGDESTTPRRSTVRPRSDEHAAGRRVQRRLNPEPRSAAPSLAERGQFTTAMVLEQRLELDIMRQSETGLSEDAIEYLHLKRKQILKKLREETSNEA